VQEAKKKQGLSLTFCKAEAEQGEDERDTAKGRAQILKAKDQFTASKFQWPERPDGNIVTYGWILIVNLFWRQLLSLILLKMSEGRLTVVGAAFVMLLHSGNVTMLLVFRPYKSKKVTNVETSMLASLFMVLWCAVIKDLLSNHVNAHTFEDTLAKVNLFIDIFAVCLMIVVIGLPAYQVYEIAVDLVNSFRSADTLLNDIFMTQMKKKEAAERSEIAQQKVIAAEDAAAESSLLLPLYMEPRFPCLSKALDKLAMSNVSASPQQRKKFRQFVQIARNFNAVCTSMVKDNAHALLTTVHAIEENRQEKEAAETTINFVAHSHHRIDHAHSEQANVRKSMLHSMSLDRDTADDVDEGAPLIIGNLGEAGKRASLPRMPMRESAMRF